MNQFKKVLIVNPLSSPLYLSEEFRKYNIQTTALYTYPKESISEYFQPNDNWFDQQIYLHTDNRNVIVDFFADEQFAFIINGTEGSLRLVEQLSNHYTPTSSNDFLSSEFRTNKYAMHLCLAKNHLPHIHQCLIDPIHQKLPHLPFDQYPQFIKPLGGACSIGAQRIDCEEQLHEYLNKWQEIVQMSITHQNDDNYGKFILADYIVGNEYLIDTFSYKGMHFLSSIQKYTRYYFKDGSQIPRYCDLITNSEYINKLSSYVFKCLDATELKNGFAHTEVFLTQDGTIKLIEINPRISGAKGHVNKLAQFAGLKSQIDLLVNHVFGIETPIKQAQSGYWRRIYLYNITPENFKWIQENVKSIVDATLFTTTTPKKNKINSLFDINAIITCFNYDLEQLNTDTQTICGLDVLE